MSSNEFNEIVMNECNHFIKISESIGNEVKQIGQLVSKAFNVQYTFLKQIEEAGVAKLNELLKPTENCIREIQLQYEKKRGGSSFANHLAAIAEGITALGWVTVKPAPAPYIRGFIEASQYYTNKVLKEWKNKDKLHEDWVNSWLETLNNLQNFVKKYHTTGLISGAKNCINPPPPPPPDFDFSSTTFNSGSDVDPNDRSALFAEINQGENITKNLKKVTPAMQTHKNPSLRTGPAPFKKSTSPSSGHDMNNISIEKSPVFVKEGKKWRIENYNGNPNLIVDNVEMNNIVYIYKCNNSTVIVKGKVNSITLDSCKKSAVVFDSVVASVEFINCQSVKMQVMEHVPTILIDKTDGCQMYLSENSLNVEIVSSKSTEMNVCLPSNDDYIEQPIPEQFKTIITPTKVLKTEIVEKKG